MSESSLEIAPLESNTLSLVETRQLDVSALVWRTKERQLIRLGDMDDQHLRNVALMLIGMSHQTYRAPDDVRVRWLTALRMEWEKRRGRT